MVGCGGLRVARELFVEAICLIGLLILTICRQLNIASLNTGWTLSILLLRWLEHLFYQVLLFRRVALPKRMLRLTSCHSLENRRVSSLFMGKYTRCCQWMCIPLSTLTLSQARGWTSGESRTFSSMVQMMLSRSTMTSKSKGKWKGLGECPLGRSRSSWKVAVIMYDYHHFII